MESHAPLQPAIAEGPQDSPLPVAGRRAQLHLDPGWAWLALGMVIVLGLVQTALRYQTYRLGIHGDMYGFLLEHEGLGPHTLLQPYNENLSAFTVLLYRAVYAIAGISNAVPYVVVSLSLMSACAVLAYVFARQALGPWLALLVPLLLMTLGPAAEVILAPEFSLFLGLALWLGAMLLIQRGEKVTDAFGCALLVLGIASHSIVVALLPATALALVLWTPRHALWRRAWVVVLPVVLYVVWHEAYHPELKHQLLKVPGFVAASFVDTVEDITGINNDAIGVALALILLGLVCARVRHLRRVPRTTIYMGLGLLTIWIGGGLNEGMGRVPGASRYQFANALLLMLALAPLVPRIRWTRLRLGILTVALVAIVVSNLTSYTNWEETFEYQELVANAQMAALEVARPAIRNPDEVFTERNGVGLYWPFTPKAYFAAIAAHGSPVNVQRDIESVSNHIHRDVGLISNEVRFQADQVLLRVEQFSVPPRARIGTVAPVALSGLPLPAAGRGCVVIPAGKADAGFWVVAPPGGLIIRPSEGPLVAVGVGRFSEPPEVIELAPEAGGSKTWLLPAHDRSNVPWHFQLTASQAVTVCSGAE